MAFDLNCIMRCEADERSAGEARPMLGIRIMAIAVTAEASTRIAHKDQPGRRIA